MSKVEFLAKKKKAFLTFMYVLRVLIIVLMSFYLCLMYCISTLPEATTSCNAAEGSYKTAVVNSYYYVGGQAYNNGDDMVFTATTW